MAELDDPGAKGFRFRHDDRMFMGFLVRTGDQVRGWVDFCPHAGWPLAMGDAYLDRTRSRILCSGHGAFFEFSGVCVAGPCVGESLTVWPVEVRDGAVWTA